MEDRIFESSRNVSIKLHHRIGRFVKIQLTFASKWIMISEIMFDSGNFQRTKITIFVCLYEIPRKITKKFVVCNENIHSEFILACFGSYLKRL